MTEELRQRGHSVNAGAPQIVKSLAMTNQVHDFGAVWQMDSCTPACGAHCDVALDPEHALPASESSSDDPFTSVLLPLEFVEVLSRFDPCRSLPKKAHPRSSNIYNEGRIPIASPWHFLRKAALPCFLRL